MKLNLVATYSHDDINHKENELHTTLQHVTVVALLQV